MLVAVYAYDIVKIREVFSKLTKTVTLAEAGVQNRLE
jgi:hypothetical protein